MVIALAERDFANLLEEKMEIVAVYVAFQAGLVLPRVSFEQAVG